jgi:glycine cleavage system aminomethyltransferase T
MAASYGGDTDTMTNPFEIRMGKYADLAVPDDTTGIQALRRPSAAGPGFVWQAIYKHGRKVGDLTNRLFSYRLQKNIGFAVIARGCAIGDRVEALSGDTRQPGILTDLPFL